MSRTRHQRLQKLFLAAVELREEERIPFLEDACRNDPEMRREVEELLAADAPEAEGFPDPIVDPRTPELVEGTGRYRILDELGRGGMGVVYLAERSDGAFRRQVALKVLQPRLGDDGDLVRRFRAERQILAALDHPHIARLLDGGTLPDGRPFLVMEHVDGEPIDHFAESRSLSVEARLELFAAVCEAVQAAHQGLVVHRDLKPSNVLVTADGTPKLLDFGIAKILDPMAFDETLAETRLGNQPLTPRYASPEQLEGGPITTATDVYALGVLLYELLTGCSPYRPRSTALHHWVQAVCEEEPLRPSLATPPEARSEGPRRRSREVARRLAGDLDHIVLTALRKEPARRYGTAAELAADLRRHLEGLPIRARPATLPYRTGKFLRRHRWGAGAVLLLTVLVGAFTFGLQRQLRRTEIERDKARQVTELLVEVFGAAGPGTANDRETTAHELLDRGMERVEGGLSDDPEIQAALLDALGRVYNNLGQVGEARRALEQAVALRRPRREEAPLELADSLDRLAVVLLGQNELEEAEALYREALELVVAEVGAEDPLAISCLDGLELVLSKSGKHREAAAMARRVIELNLRRLGFRDAAAATASDSTEPGLVVLATTLSTLATEQRHLGEYDAAEENFERALTLGRRLLGEDHYAVAFALNNLANSHSSLERYETARATRSEALTIAEGALGPSHPAVASIRLNQGFDLARLGRDSEALDVISTAKAALAASLGAAHPATAVAMSYQGIALLGLDRPEEAEELQRRAVELLLQGLGEDHPDLAEARASLAETLLALRRTAESIDQYSLACTSFERALGAEHPDTLDCRSRAAGSLLAAGRNAEARLLLEPAVAALESRDDLPVHLAQARFRLACALTQAPPAGPRARELATEALAVFRRQATPELPAAESWLATFAGQPAERGAPGPSR